MAEAKAALDASHALRMAAAVVGTHNLKKAQELTERADKLYFGEDTDKANAEQDAIKIWEEAHGGSMSDPAFRDKMYELAAKYRKMTDERDVEAVRQRQAKIQLAADRQKRTQEKLRRNRRGRPA